jgi:outer membrane lipoprotein-sorting protein
MIKTPSLFYCAFVIVFSMDASAKGEPVQAPRDLKKILSQVQTQYDRIQDFSGRFTQVFHHRVLKRKDTSEGNVKFKKPGFMRWNYSKPSNKAFIVDGKSLWIYQPDDKLAMVDRCFKQDTLTASLSFLWGGGYFMGCLWFLLSTSAA